MFSFHHTAISVSDISKSEEFYAKLGFKRVLTWRSDSNDLEISHFKLGDFYLEMFRYSNAQEKTVAKDLNEDLPRIGVRHFAVQTSSIEDAKKFVEDCGIAIQVEIKKGRTGVRYFFLKDPDGIFVEIVEDKRQL